MMEVSDMTAMSEVKAIVRNDFLPDLVSSLEKAEVTRLFVSRIHALGAGVDPDDYRLSMDDGQAYTEKAKVEVLCPTEAVEAVIGVIRECACTGRRGDGLVVVSGVREVVNIRTGDRDGLALI